MLVLIHAATVSVVSPLGFHQLPAFASAPWQFNGRLWYRPALVRKPEASAVPDGVTPLSLFGWTLGGHVVLQYDDSPVAATPQYREYVRMGGLVTKRGTVGLLGSRLYVSTPEAQADNVAIWGVPAVAASIEYDERGGSLKVDTAPPLTHDASDGPPTIRVSGWRETRSDARLRLDGWDAARPRGNLPVLWTPRITTLWAPFVPLDEPDDIAPLETRRLRISASSLRLHWCSQPASRELGMPLPIGMSLDGVRIEIGEPKGLEL